MGAAIFGRNNLIASDFEGRGRVENSARVSTRRERAYSSSFRYRGDAIGKVQSAEVSDALDVLELSDEEYR